MSSTASSDSAAGKLGAKCGGAPVCGFRRSAFPTHRQVMEAAAWRRWCDMADEHGPAEFSATLRDHANALGALETEVLGIKTTLAGQDRKLDKLFDVIRDTQQKTGPGIKEVLTLCGIAGGIISMVAAAIMVLVLSVVQPPQARIETSHAALLAKVDRIEASAWAELQEYRKGSAMAAVEKAKGFDERIRDLEKRTAWAPGVTVTK